MPDKIKKDNEFKFNKSNHYTYIFILILMLIISYPLINWPSQNLSSEVIYLYSPSIFFALSFGFLIVSISCLYEKLTAVVLKKHLYNIGVICLSLSAVLSIFYNISHKDFKKTTQLYYCGVWLKGAKSNVAIEKYALNEMDCNKQR